MSKQFYQKWDERRNESIKAFSRMMPLPFKKSKHWIFSGLKKSIHLFQELFFSQQFYVAHF